MLRHARRTLGRRRRAWRGDLAAWRRFWASYRRYQQLAPPDRQPSLRSLYPCLGDDTAETEIEPIYFYQDAWAFQRIVRRRPVRHVDVGSHHKFVALLSAVVPVTMVDLRPLALPLETLTFREGSICDLPFDDSSVPSVSSLCVVEHIGLGRYGDPLDPYGSERAIGELKRVVSREGDLYLSLPLGDEDRTHFNAHRVFSEATLLRLFEPFDVVERRYIHGRRFGEQRQDGSGVGCYHLRAPR